MVAVAEDVHKCLPSARREASMPRATANFGSEADVPAMPLRSDLVVRDPNQPLLPRGRGCALALRT